MFSTLTPHSFFGHNRRLERLPRQNREASSIDYSAYNQKVVVNQLNILASLYPKRSELHSHISPRAHSSMSGRSSRTSHYTSSSTTSSAIPHYPSCSSSSYEFDTTPRIGSFRSRQATSRKDTNSRSINPPTNNQARLSEASSEADSSSVHSWIDLKQRKRPPPPLLLEHSNLHRKPTIGTPAIEIIAPGPPRVDSRLSSYSSDRHSSQSITPTSPEFHLPTEEEIVRRRHQKVMRTLGERVPADLIYQVPKIPNVTVFPEPPSPKEKPTPESKKKLGRRGSFTLSALLPTSNHTRSKSTNILDEKERSPHALSLARSLSQQTRFPDITSKQTQAQSTRYLPESPCVYSPIVFADALGGLEETSGIPSNHDGHYSMGEYEPQAEKGLRLARRASLPPAIVLNNSPEHDDSSDHHYSPPSNSPRLERRSLNLGSPRSHDFYINAPQSRPHSTALSPLVFSKHLSLMPSEHIFSLTINDVDDQETSTQEREQNPPSINGDDNEQTTPSPRRKHMYALSEGGNASLSTTLGYHSNPHLPSKVRPDTPFQDSGVPKEGESNFLTPHEWSSRGHELLQRKERRQGWSGEWNQKDMQDVIQKLRNLK
ncbi:hypothetical protein H0H92_000432 [Tricholoma furcatifolium]|nr:hypothetical protein H0H92_000432 [Tricholoma furcatifolium]